MKILIISGTNPHSEGAFEAANVINYEIVKNLLLSGNHQVSCLTINTKEIKWPDQSIIQKNELIQLGVNFLPDLIIPKKTKNNLSLTKILKIFLANPATLIDGVEYAGLLNEHIKNDTFEIALTVWSEFCTGMTYGLKIPVYAYYGNPDPKVAIANWYRKWKLENNKKSIRNLLKSSLDRIYINFKEIAHLKVMNKLNGVFDVALNDTNYYKKKGIKNVTYIRNMWGDLDYQWKIKKKNLIKGKKIKIIGNVGNLSATGNSFGMFILVTEILPELRKRLGEDNFEIHLLGGGLPSKKLKELLNTKNIFVRGFVKNINKEILSSHVFLVANNWNPLFRVGNTRFLHAWSLGSCCISFLGSKEAMPELVHGHNILLGENPKKVASLITKAALDSGLREELGINGFETLSKYFSPKLVVRDIEERLI